VCPKDLHVRGGARSHGATTKRAISEEVVKAITHMLASRKEDDGGERGSSGGLCLRNEGWDERMNFT